MVARGSCFGVVRILSYVVAPEPPDRDFLTELVDLLRAALSENAIGGYLHGSTGHSRLFPRSDLDVLVVTRTPLTSTQRSALTDLALSKSGRYPPLPSGPRPVELTVVPESEVNPWHYPPRCDFLYGEWLRDDVEAGSGRRRCEDSPPTGKPSPYRVVQTPLPTCRSSVG